MLSVTDQNTTKIAGKVRTESLDLNRGLDEIPCARREGANAKGFSREKKPRDFRLGYSGRREQQNEALGRTGHDHVNAAEGERLGKELREGPTNDRNHM